MKIMLTICVALMALFFGTAQAASGGESFPQVTYVVKKGDTLTAIAGEFPEDSVAAISKRNNIRNPDLIYPGTVLSISRAPREAAGEGEKIAESASTVARVAPLPVVSRVSQKSTVKTVCNTAPIVSRLDYPAHVSKQLEALVATHTAAQKEFPFRGVVTYGGDNYHLLLNEHCVATKIVDRPKIVTETEHTQENTAALTPRPRVPIATSDTGRTDNLTDAEMGIFLARIKNELQTIMGPGEDVSSLVIPLALAVLHKGETGEAVLSWLKKTGGNR